MIVHNTDRIFSWMMVEGALGTEKPTGIMV